MGVWLQKMPHIHTIYMIDVDDFIPLHSESLIYKENSTILELMCNTVKQRPLMLSNRQPVLVNSGLVGAMSNIYNTPFWL